MNLHQVTVVYAKEITDIIRDRRTLISMILIPMLIIPLIGGGLGTLMESQIDKMEEKTFTISVNGEEHAPILFSALEENGQFQIISGLDSAMAMELLKDASVLTIVNVPPGFEHRLGKFFRGEAEAPALNLIYDESEIESEIAAKNLRGVINEYRRKIVAMELERMNLRGNITEPFEIKLVNTATKEEMGGFVAGMMLPVMLILLSITGAMYPAIDLTAGEKERGTLETLLVSPVGRAEMVLGKYLTVMTASLVTTILVLISITVTMSSGLLFGPTGGEGVQMSFNILHLLSALVMMLPLIAFFSALLMTLSVFAKSYKEAQSYVSPLMIIAIIPAMITYLPGIEPNAKLLLIPVVNVAMTLKEALMGNYDPAMIAESFLSSAVYAAIAVWITFKQFKRENVLFRT